jgi:hypothetical protein
LDFSRKSSKIVEESCKTTHSRRRYSCQRVHGLVLFADDLEPLATVRGDLHLVAEAHVVGDVLARHADVVGDLVDLIALLGAGQDAGASQAVWSDGRPLRDRCLTVDLPAQVWLVRTAVLLLDSVSWLSLL